MSVFPLDDETIMGRPINAGIGEYLVLLRRTNSLTFGE
jgi:hypothetical protein